MAAKRYLTNDYHDCRLVRLDPRDSTSPIVVTQEGCAHDDPLAKTHLFYLQRDGHWINEIARSTRPDSEVGQIVFERPGEVVQLLATLFGKAKVRAIATTEADTEAYIAKAKSYPSTEAAYRDFLARYRAAKGKT